MKPVHEDIKHMLPEYLKGALPSAMKEDVELHLKDCRECREELSVLSEVFSVEAPDPGELFWQTLPGKAALSSRKKRHAVFSLRSLLFSPFPLATVVVILFLAVFAFIKKKDNADSELFFSDPLAVSDFDYGKINDKDIPSITEQISGEELPIRPEDFMGYSYHKEFASLNSKEMEGLYEALKSEQKTGG